MKCLRCGREIGNNLECPCGHFYKNNISNRVITKKRDYQTIITLLVVVVIFSILIIVLVNLGKENPKYNEVCDIRCEGLEYKINNNTCECSNGMVYPID